MEANFELSGTTERSGVVGACATTGAVTPDPPPSRLRSAMTPSRRAAICAAILSMTFSKPEASSL
jgi:hypothetical protein